MRALSAALLAALVLSGCGSSGHHASSTGTSASTPPDYTTATSTIPSSVTTPPASTSTASSTPTSTGSGTAGGGAGTTTTTGGSSGSSGARIPATFVIQAGEQANPSTVNAPALVPIQVTIVSGDGKPHTALVRTSPSHTLRVGAHGRASVLLPGQPNGRYEIVLDHGAGLATLLVGGAPGP